MYFRLSAAAVDAAAVRQRKQTRNIRDLWKIQYGKSETAFRI